MKQRHRPMVESLRVERVREGARIGLRAAPRVDRKNVEHEGNHFRLTILRARARSSRANRYRLTPYRRPSIAYVPPAADSVWVPDVYFPGGTSTRPSGSSMKEHSSSR